MPSDIAVDSLRDDQMAEFKRPKDWLYSKRTQVRLDRERAERKQRKRRRKSRERRSNLRLKFS